jgi:chromate transporter
VSHLELFLVFLKAVFLSSGGLQALPIGRIAPGPNGLFVISIGYYIAGLPGALIGAIALIIPPMLAIGLVHAHRRLANRPWVEGMTRGIAASAVALLAALGYSFTVPLLAQPASVAILVAALVFLIAARVDALLVLGGGALVAVALFLLGIPLA